MVGEKRRSVTKRDIAELKRKIKELQKEVNEIKTAFYEYTSEPYRAILDFLGVSGGERVFTDDGIGVGYAEITKKLEEERNSRKEEKAE